MVRFINKVAAHVEPGKQTSLRVVQQRLSGGAGLGVAVKRAYPDLPAPARTIVSTSLVKAACRDRECVKYALAAR